MITIKNIEIGKGKPLALIAGPCQIESATHAQTMAGSIKEIADLHHAQIYLTRLSEKGGLRVEIVFCDF